MTVSGQAEKFSECSSHTVSCPRKDIWIGFGNGNTNKTICHSAWPLKAAITSRRWVHSLIHKGALLAKHTGAITARIDARVAQSRFAFFQTANILLNLKENVEARNPSLLFKLWDDWDASKANQEEWNRWERMEVGTGKRKRNLRENDPIFLSYIFYTLLVKIWIDRILKAYLYKEDVYKEEIKGLKRDQNPQSSLSWVSNQTQCSGLPATNPGILNSSSIRGGDLGDLIRKPQPRSCKSYCCYFSTNTTHFEIQKKNDVRLWVKIHFPECLQNDLVSGYRFVHLKWWRKNWLP